jgi:hypothetical protein
LIGNHGLDVIRNRDTAQIHISPLREISHDHTTQPNRPTRSLSQQFAGRLHNPHNSTSDSAAADKCDIQFRVARHNEPFRSQPTNAFDVNDIAGFRLDRKEASDLISPENRISRHSPGRCHQSRKSRPKNESVPNLFPFSS